MYLLIYPVGGLGKVAPLKMLASQVLVCQDNGTPIAVAGAYGPERTQLVAHAGDDDFNDTLHKLGIPVTVLCDDIALPQPAPGAQLLSGPRRGTSTRKGLVLHG